MSAKNHSQFIGHLGQDPEVKVLEGGRKVASFSLATNETYKDKKTGEKKTVTDWHNIVAFGPLAELSQKYLKKGSEVLVIGKHKSQTYEDKDKIKRTRSYFLIDEITFISRAKVAEEAETAVEEAEDDLPF